MPEGTLGQRRYPSIVACGGQFNPPLWISKTAFTCLTEIKGSEYQGRLKGEGAVQQTDPLRASPLIPASEEEPVKRISLCLEPPPSSGTSQQRRPRHQAFSPACPLGLLSQCLDVLMTLL